MSENLIERDLVCQAQRQGGDRLNRLCEITRDRLTRYVRRTALDEALVEDVVQETYTEMFRCFHKLKNPDSFWPWLRGIAFNKLRQRYKSEKRQKALLQPEVAYMIMQRNRANHSTEHAGHDSRNDLKEVIVAAMKHISPKYRAVINLRCFEGMDYREMAELLGCTELNARVLFYRAKKALQKQLTKRGVSKAALLSSLALFADITAQDSTAGASSALSPALLHVGAGPMVVAGIVSLKGGIAVFLAVLSVGLFAVTSKMNDNVAAAGHVTRADVYSGTDYANEFDESWYYFPEGRKGPVLQWHSGGPTQYLQNDQGNYEFTNGRAVTHNYRLWQRNLAVTRLPVDAPSLQSFLNTVEDRDGPAMETVQDDGQNLLIVRRKDGHGTTKTSVMHIEQAMNELYFKYGRAVDQKMVDLRDDIHQRGWTYFTISGDLNHVPVTGIGMMPLTYTACRENPSWLKVKLGDAVWITDGPAQATCTTSDGETTIHAAGHFFQGLSRPWMGLHTIDIIRRDAARQGIVFETHGQNNGKFVTVTLDYERNNNSCRVIYTIDLFSDIITGVQVVGENNPIGQLDFHYPLDLDRSPFRFDPPRTTSRSSAADRSGHLLLIDLVEMAMRQADLK